MFILDIKLFLCKTSCQKCKNWDHSGSKNIHELFWGKEGGGGGGDKSTKTANSSLLSEKSLAEWLKQILHRKYTIEPPVFGHMHTHEYLTRRQSILVRSFYEDFLNENGLCRPSIGNCICIWAISVYWKDDNVVYPRSAQYGLVV